VAAGFDYLVSDYLVVWVLGCLFEYWTVDSEDHYLDLVAVSGWMVLVRVQVVVD
jgi:hypothetical protein